MCKEQNYDSNDDYLQDLNENVNAKLERYKAKGNGTAMQNNTIGKEV
jgi:hypothetical protein